MKKCLEHNKPVVFHAGLSWEPDTLCKYSHPLRFEEVALEFPQLRPLSCPYGMALGAGDGHADD